MAKSVNDLMIVIIVIQCSVCMRVSVMCMHDKECKKIVSKEEGCALNDNSKMIIFFF